MAEKRLAKYIPGKITYPEYWRIPLDFSKLKWNHKTPTDIDGFVNFDGKAFVFIEAKYKSALMPTGQRHAFEALVDSLSVPSVLVVVTYENDRDMSVSTVVTYRSSKTWYVPNVSILLKPFIDKFLVYNKVL